MADAVSPLSAWPHPVRWPEIQHGPSRLELVADSATLGRVAAALDLVAAKSLRADLTLGSWLDGIAIDGRIEALVTRICGVSLEPFDEAIDEAMSVRIVPPGSPNAPAAPEADIMLDLEAEDPPDVLEGDTIDLGAYVVEHLALALDPFPRRPGAVFQPPQAGEPPGPFAVLAGLKTRDGD